MQKTGEKGLLTDFNADFSAGLISSLPENGLALSDLFLAKETLRLAEKGLSLAEKEALLVIILALLASANEGSTRLKISDNNLPQELLKSFKLPLEFSETLKKLITWLLKTEKEPGHLLLKDLAGRAGDYKPLIVEEGWLYLQKNYVLESRVAALLKAGLTEDLKTDLNEKEREALADVLKRPPKGPGGEKAVLDKEQINALKTALKGKITIISGRPGSGKTSIVLSLLRVLLRLGLKAENIALAAPTGKAADRLQQAVALQLAAIENPGSYDLKLGQAPPQASTLHRLLGYSYNLDRFNFNENNPLGFELIVVDEASMLDLYLADSLLRAQEAKSRLVLLGDADQLPSIDAGAVLFDLCLSKLANENQRVAVLKKSYRAREDNPDGAAILALAEAINQGHSFGAGESAKLFTKRRRVKDIEMRGTEFLTTENALQRTALFEHWLHKMLETKFKLTKMVGKVYRYGPEGFSEKDEDALKLLFAHYEKFRILCATRILQLETSSEAVNSWFHQRWQKQLNEKGRPYYQQGLLAGEPVMVNSNDYHLALYNGDTGLVLKILREGIAEGGTKTLSAVFRQGPGFVAHPLALLQGRLDAAWATTVHKAQGSEYDHVLLLLPGQMVRTLSKELIYTAVTRAKQSVLIAGLEQVFYEAAALAYARQTALATLL